ncbi:flagellar protein FlaF [Methanogenium organophilum]|uniref:Flagellar protein FlaF n=1 Tax=Methanogenium organophilum TaxID=2199 RepID=A0A9X9T7F8_METOG|nr:flagellar protein FlaF [Methanogenium organophilum]WAI01044.1 flagellar protein FlaF [Methanogenium organophilum]
MGSASLIATAIALVLLIVTAYVVVGGILATSDIVTMSQSERFSLQESRLHTSIDIFDITVLNETHTLTMIVNNSGNEKISQFKYMDIYMIYPGAEPILAPYTETPSTENTWSVSSISPDIVHPNELDPGESATITVTYTTGIIPLWIKIATPNGVYDSAYINS